MLNLRDVASVITGLNAILRFRPDAFTHFDATLNGFWKSFWAAAITAPIWLILVTSHMSEAQAQAPVTYLLAHAVSYAVGWLAFPLLMVRISSYLDRWPRYFHYMVAYNWFQVCQSLIWLPLVLVSETAGQPSGLVTVLWRVSNGLLFAYGWFIARRGLMVEAGSAAALVLIDFLLGMLIDGITEALVQ